jgi:hypothetical protein
MTYTVPSFAERDLEEKVADNLKAEAVHRRYRSVKKKAGALTEKWHAWEEALQ